MTLELTERVILVTGAARGLGLAYTRVLIECGATVLMQDAGVDKDGGAPDPGVVEATARDLASPTAYPLGGLLDSEEACRAVVQTAFDRFGRLDGLIHNAGLVHWVDLPDVDQDIFRRASAINHEAALWLCKASLPIMRAQDYGRIVLTSSGWALQPHPGSGELALYSHGKGAQLGLGIALAHGAGHPNVLTNILVPIANTRIYVSDVPEGKLAPEAVAGTAAWLVSPACKIKGQVLRVADGRIALMEMKEVGERQLGARARDPAACGEAITDLITENDA